MRSRKKIEEQLTTQYPSTTRSNRDGILRLILEVLLDIRETLKKK